MVASPERTIFISRAGADAALAEQIGKILEADGYHVILQQWDFANSSFMNEMHEALRGEARVLGLLSPHYLATDYCTAEWQAAIAKDPLNRNRRLILLKVAECEPDGLLRPLAYWDVVSIRHDPRQLAAAVRDAVRASHRPTEVPSAPLYRQSQSLFDPSALRGAPNFTGREAELKNIRTAFAGGSHTIAIYGLPGAGKSALASEYAKRMRERYAAVWRLPAESETGIIDGLVGFGSAFIPELENMRDRVSAAERVLAGIDAEFPIPVLLIFDNADNEALIRRWCPLSGAHVLITTRLAAWAGEVATCHLSSLPLEDAITYLKRESGRSDLSRTDYGDIANALGCLPLALAQAAAYLKRTRNVTGRRYIEQLTHHLETAPRGLGEDRAVFATFQDLITKAEQEAPGAAAVLCFAALFAPDAIPEELLQQRTDSPGAALRPTLPLTSGAARDLSATLEDQFAVDEALGALDRLSLITFDAASRTFSMHRLVQSTSAHLLASTKKGWFDYALATVEAAFPNVTYATWPACDRLLPHALAVLGARPNNVLSASAAGLSRRCALYLYTRAAFSDAEPLFRRALIIDEASYGPEHPDVAADLNNLAGLLRATNRLAEAEPLYRRALAIDEASYGPDHPAVATIRANLASMQRDMER